MADTMDRQFDQDISSTLSGRDERLSEVMKTMLGYTLMIIFLPLISYYVSKNMIFEGLYEMSRKDAFFYGGITAVVVVHIVLAAFIYTAWNEDNKPRPRPVKRD
ncbi:vacuolar ATPase assembly integral membrane protein vma21-like isoform X1 [Glandiceps talaboti]